ncbi:MAG: outer membrane beta-barrel protein [Kofleriaceae bacterium]
MFGPRLAALTAAAAVAVGARATSLADPAAATAPIKPSAVTLGGYLETYYQLNLRLPSNRITNLRGFDNRDRTFTISNVAIDAKGERGPVTARLVLQVGSTPSTYYLAEPRLPGTPSVNATGPELWKYIQIATLAYAAPFELDVEAGVFLSPVGPETMPIKDNWNWSRSTLFFGLPFYHTGARVSRPLGRGWTGTLAMYSGWNSVIDSNPWPSLAVSAAYASDRLTGQLLYFGGVERPSGAPEGAPWRNLFDAYAQLVVTDALSVQVHGDAGFERDPRGTSGWAAAAIYAKLELASALYVAVRGDYFHEWTAEGTTPIFWPPSWIAAATATIAAQPADKISVRLEYRHDHASEDAYFSGDVAGTGVTTPFVPDARAQDTITLGATAWF